MFGRYDVLKIPPYILAIETIGASGSVTALRHDVLLAEHPLRPDQRSAQSLASALKGLLDEVGWKPRDVTLVAALAGPGSFTGLRVGITTAKMFAFAVDAEVAGIGSLEICAAQALGVEAPRLWTVIDAGRQQQFAASFVKRPTSPPEAGTTAHALGLLAGWFTEREPAIVDNAALGKCLQAGDAIAGPGLTTLAQLIPPQVHMLDAESWTPRAATVGRLAALRCQHGGRDDLLTLVPNYLRHSAAEEKWLARQAGG